MVGKTRKDKQINCTLSRKSINELNDRIVEQVTPSHIKIEPPEFVVVNDTSDSLSRAPVDASVCIKEEPIDALQPFTFINEECFDENTDNEDNNESWSTCGRIMQTLDDGVIIYRLKCSFCKCTFSTTFNSFWHEFVTHLTEKHESKSKSNDNHIKNMTNVDVIKVNMSKEVITSIVNDEKIDKPVKEIESAIQSCLIEKSKSNSKDNTNVSDSEDNNIENVDHNDIESDESEKSDDETYEPRAKKTRTSTTIGDIQSAQKIKKDKDHILSFDHPNKDCVIAFLELLKTNPILWHPRQYIVKRFDEALNAVSVSLYERFPNFKMTKEQVRQSINRIKDMYSRGSNETLKRRVKSHIYKTKHPEYFELCAAIEENSKNIIEKCHICEAIFYSSVSLQIHKVKRHRIGELPFKCQRCGYGFACPEKLASHEAKHNRVKSFRCELCNQSFYFENKLQAHMVLHTDDSKLICEICGKKFPTQSKYRRHKLHHEEPKEKCEICGKLYFEKWTLSEHMKSHLNERHYKCDICGKSFNRQEGVTIHKRGVHKIKLQTKKYVWVNRVAKSSNSDIAKQNYDIGERGDTQNSNSNSSLYSSVPNEQNTIDVKPQISNNFNHQIFPLEMLNTFMN